MKKHRNSIEFKVYGNYALFSDPIMRVGGEKFSYQIPTYQSIVGIVESIYWKPCFYWVIDAVRVMKMIQTESKGIKPIKMSGGNDLAYYTYLREVEYQVLAHFEWNLNRPELESDRNEHKHHNIAKRSIIKGGRRDVFLGSRECQGYVEPCVFGEGKGAYDEQNEMDFGMMFHGFNYPSETGDDLFEKRLWRAKMFNGVITFIEPTHEQIIRSPIRKMSFKKFHSGLNYSDLEDDIALEELLDDEVIL